MSEVQTTLVDKTIVKNSWGSRFPFKKWSDNGKWIDKNVLPNAYEYRVIVLSDDYTLVFPYVVKTYGGVKKVYRDDLEFNIRSGVNYGKAFVVDRGEYVFYYADKYKLTENTTRIKKISLRLFYF